MTLPVGWAEATIAEITIINPKHPNDTDRSQSVSFVPMLAVDEHLGAITGATDRPLEEIWTGYTHFADGDVIFAKITPCMENGKAAVASGLTNGLACGSTEFYVLRSQDGIDCHYLWRFLRQDWFLAEAEKHMSGAVGQRRVPRLYLEEYSLPLPPAAEQRRIVAKLDALTARIARARAELDRVLVLGAHFRRMALVACFSSVPNAPIELGTLLHAIEAGKNLRCEERIPREGENGVVKVSAVTWGRFDATQSKTLPSDYEPPEKSRIRKGDLLISRANTLELVGAVVLVENQPRDLFLSDKILRLVADDADKKWILWFLKSPDGRNQIEALATGNQLSMRNISQEALRRIKLPMPDVATRTQRVRMLETTFARADRLEVEAARARALLDRLESSILAKAFRGKLVPQDDNDEPASVLLERIREERAAKPKKARTS